MTHILKRLFILTLFLFSAMGITNVHGQDSPLVERIRSIKIAFITERLNLTPEESQLFWPIYNQFDERQSELKKEYVGDNTNLQMMSDEEADGLLNNYLKMQEERLRLEKKYIADLKQVLSKQKVLRLLKAERDFQTRLINLIKERQENKRGFRNWGN